MQKLHLMMTLKQENHDLSQFLTQLLANFNQDTCTYKNCQGHFTITNLEF